ncbi:hypothetical protein KDA00_04805, partial [Candidatus Saccharibacteria bacterium]|nr:hypothetical protein [Candidatus Saccharibacteria bacterium]
MSKKVKRLFSEFIPENYDLYLDINREKAKFAGKVTIRGQKVSRPNKRITFHQSGLKAISAKIIKHNKKDNSEFTVSRINNHDSFDEMRIHSGELLHPGSYTIEIEFSGKITPQMNGIYPCNFKINGKNKQLIATQFESHHAREVFPCIDEPEAKATFDLSITSPKGETVIANTPVKSQ